MSCCVPRAGSVAVVAQPGLAVPGGDAAVAFVVPGVVPSVAGVVAVGAVVAGAVVAGEEVAALVAQPAAIAAATAITAAPTTARAGAPDEAVGRCRPCSAGFRKRTEDILPKR